MHVFMFVTLIYWESEMTDVRPLTIAAVTGLALTAGIAIAHAYVWHKVTSRSSALDARERAAASTHGGGAAVTTEACEPVAPVAPVGPESPVVPLRRLPRLVLLDVDTVLLDVTAANAAVNAVGGAELYKNLPAVPGALEATRAMLADPALDVYFVCAGVSRADDTRVADKWLWLTHHFGDSIADRLVATADKTLLLNNPGALLVSADNALTGRYASHSRGTRFLFGDADASPTSVALESKRGTAASAPLPVVRGVASCLRIPDWTSPEWRRHIRALPSEYQKWRTIRWKSACPHPGSAPGRHAATGAVEPRARHVRKAVAVLSDWQAAVASPSDEQAVAAVPTNGHALAAAVPSNEQAAKKASGSLGRDASHGYATPDSPPVISA